MIRKTHTILALTLLTVLLGLIPVFSNAQEGLVPCGIDKNNDGVVSGEAEECDYSDLVTMAKKFMEFMVILSIPLAVIGFVWAGFLYLTAGANEGQVGKAKSLLMKIAIGFFFVLAAWLIVNTITSTLFVGKDSQGNTPSLLLDQ